VAKLDDVTIRADRRSRGAGAGMLASLCEYLQGQNIARIDTACHRDNARAWRFYERLGFRPLDEERIALLL
jgi:RimJ/RimL family protein N-acetyltransferase